MSTVTACADTSRRPGALSIIRSKNIGINGPFNLVQGFVGAFVRIPVFIANSTANETFGLALGAGKLTCDIC